MRNVVVIMAASSTCKSLTVCNLGVTFARCTGFTKIHSQNDYSFIIDTEWTDERSQSVKRTYAEFQKLHQDLLRLFPELRKLERSKLQLKTSEWLCSIDTVLCAQLALFCLGNLVLVTKVLINCYYQYLVQWHYKRN